MPTHRKFRLAPESIRRSDFRIERPKEVPDRAYGDVLRALRNRKAREATVARARRDQAERAAREYQERLSSIIGARNLPKYLKFRNRSVEEMREARLRLPESERGMRELAEMGRERAAEALDFVRSLGVDTGRIERLQQEFRRRWKAKLDATTDGLAARQVAKRGNQTFYPPFNGWSWVLEIYEHMSDPTAYLWTWPGKTPVANRATGDVGFASTLGVCYSTGEDQVNLWSRASVVQWYQVPKPGGKLTVRIRAKLGGSSNLCHHSGYISSWTGFGGGQEMEMLAVVYSGGSATGSVSWKVFDRIDQYAKSLNWKDDAFVGGLAPGKTLDFGPSPVVPGNFAAGTWVAVEAGVFHLNGVDSYNPAMESTVEAAATIKEIGVSVLGP